MGSKSRSILSNDIILLGSR